MSKNRASISLTQLSQLQKVRIYTWDIVGNQSKRTKLHNYLFGYKQQKAGKTYYYDGILTAWNDTKRSVRVHHTIIGQSMILIPEMMIQEGYRDEILNAFKRAKVNVREMVLVENKYHVFNGKSWC